MRLTWAFLLGVVAVGAPGRADAADVTDVASAFDDDNPFDFRLRVRYDHTEKRAQIKREFEGLSPTQTSIAQLKDLLLRAAARRPDPARRGRPLSGSHAQRRAAHRDRRERDLLLRQLGRQRLPLSARQPIPTASTPATPPPSPTASWPPTGYDAQHDGAGTSGGALFRTADRGASGGGSGWTPSTRSTSRSPGRRSARRATTPSPPGSSPSRRRSRSATSWRSTAPRPTPTTPSPKASTGSIGTHRDLAPLSLRRSLHGFWYMYPIARDDSLFKDYGPSQKTKNPSSRRGTIFGMELIPYERPRRRLQGLHRSARPHRGPLRRPRLLRGVGAVRLVAGARLRRGARRLQPRLRPDADDERLPERALHRHHHHRELRHARRRLRARRAGRAALPRCAARFEYTHDQSHFITGDDIGVPTTGVGPRDEPARVQPGLPRRRSTRSAAATASTTSTSTTSTSGRSCMF